MFKLALLILGICSYTWAKNDCTHDSKTFRCVKYIKNYDADTITFNIPGVHPIVGEKINVRVLGVDTPEIRTKNKCEKEKARNSKRLVKNLLKNAKRIDLKDISRGKYFRVVADVIIDVNEDEGV
jgi:endonuclease YncB( thermonuclease family)